LLAGVEAVDRAEVVDGMSIPEELAGREDRLVKLAAARAKLEACAKERSTRATDKKVRVMASRAGNAVSQASSVRPSK
jgi:hypothetical protein